LLINDKRKERKIKMLPLDRKSKHLNTRVALYVHGREDIE